MLSFVIVISVCGFWIWVLGRLRRRRPGLPEPDRSCNRDYYRNVEVPE